jgi:hypothetical protein
MLKCPKEESDEKRNSSPQSSNQFMSKRKTYESGYASGRAAWPIDIEMGDDVGYAYVLPPSLSLRALSKGPDDKLLEELPGTTAWNICYDQVISS